MTPSKGWPTDAVEFFEGLEADNSKTYWQEHKVTYETKVRVPMDALLAELAQEFGAGKVFRPYRDVRFSKDKSPYKTNIAATVEHGGYITLSADGYPKDHPRIGLLKYKGLITWRSWPPAAWLGTSKAKDRIVTFFHDSRPVVGWLDAHVGPAEG